MSLAAALIYQRSHAWLMKRHLLAPDSAAEIVRPTLQQIECLSNYVGLSLHLKSLGHPDVGVNGSSIKQMMTRSEVPSLSSVDRRGDCHGDDDAIEASFMHASLAFTAPAETSKIFRRERCSPVIHNLT